MECEVNIVESACGLDGTHPLLVARYFKKSLRSPVYEVTVVVATNAEQESVWSLARAAMKGRTEYAHAAIITIVQLPGVPRDCRGGDW